MKTILLPFHGEPADEPTLALGAVVAQRFAGYVEGVLCMQRPTAWVGEQYIKLPPESLAELTKEWRRTADKARERFIQSAEAKGLAFREGMACEGQPTAGWHEAEGREDQVIADYARVFDITVVGRRAGGAGVNWEATTTSALFESGRPVLVSPEQPMDRFGDAIVVAWNGSTETARTIGLGMPLLSQARQVVVLTVEGWMVPPHTGKRVAEHLQCHGIDAKAHVVAPQGRSNGQAILDACLELGADLVMKGAYTHHRFAQLIFGGATQHIMNHATLPVFMAH